MAFERNRPATNPSRRPMSVQRMEHPIKKLNEEAFKRLDEMEREKSPIRGLINCEDQKSGLH